MKICKYCGIQLNKITSGHLRKCLGYLNSSDKKGVPHCLCGHNASSKTVMQKHRQICEIWKSRDVNKLRSERCINTCLLKYNVQNPMQFDNVKQKVQTTMTDRYGAHSFSKESSIFPKVLRSIRLQSPLKRKKIATEKFEEKQKRYEENKTRLINETVQKEFEFLEVIVKLSLSDHHDFFDKYHYSG